MPQVRNPRDIVQVRIHAWTLRWQILLKYDCIHGLNSLYLSCTYNKHLLEQINKYLSRELSYSI